MSSILGYASALRTSVDGIREQFERAGVAARRVAQASSGSGAVDEVDISTEAVARAASGAREATSGIEKPMVDMRVAKYAAIANMRVLSAADQMAEEIVGLADRRPRQQR
jgi:hypothetical protein